MRYIEYAHVLYAFVNNQQLLYVLYVLHEILLMQYI